MACTFIEPTIPCQDAQNDDESPVFCEVEWGAQLRLNKYQEKKIDQTCTVYGSSKKKKQQKIKKRRVKVKCRCPLESLKEPIRNCPYVVTDRKALTHREHLTLLATPKRLPFRIHKSCKPRNIIIRSENVFSVVPPRYQHLSFPKAPTVLYTWQRHRKVLIPEKITFLAETLKKIDALTTQDAHLYFQKLKKLQRKKFNAAMKKRPHTFLCYGKSQSKKDIDKFIDKTIKFFIKTPLAALKYRHTMITNEIITRILNKNLAKALNRCSKHPYSVTLYDFIDQISVWIDAKLDELDLADLEEEEEMLSLSTTATDTSATDSTLLYSCEGVRVKKVVEIAEEEEEGEEEWVLGEEVEEAYEESIVSEVWEYSEEAGEFEEAIEEVEIRGVGEGEGAFEGEADIEARKVETEALGEVVAEEVPQEFIEVAEEASVKAAPEKAEVVIAPVAEKEEDEELAALNEVTEEAIKAATEPPPPSPPPEVAVPPETEAEKEEDEDLATLNEATKEAIKATTEPPLEVAVAPETQLPLAPPPLPPEVAVPPETEAPPAPPAPPAPEVVVPPETEAPPPETETTTPAPPPPPPPTTIAPTPPPPPPPPPSTPPLAQPETVVEAAPETTVEALPEVTVEVSQEAPVEAPPEAPKIAPSEAPVITPPVAPPETPGIVPLEGSSVETEAVPETAPSEVTPPEDEPREAVPEIPPEETAPETAVPEQAVPEQAVPEEAVPEEALPEEALPEEEVPEEAVPEETIPEETAPEDIKESVIEEGVPVETGKMTEGITEAEAEPEGVVKAVEEGIRLLEEEVLGLEGEELFDLEGESAKEVGLMDICPFKAMVAAEETVLQKPIAILKSKHVEEHSPDMVCCLTLKLWAGWLLEVAHNSQNWCKWVTDIIGQIRLYAAILRGEVRNSDGTVRLLYRQEWEKFKTQLESDIIGFQQYNLHVKDLSEEIIEKFHGKRVACCLACLQQKMILSVDQGHEVSQQLTEAIRTADYWRRWLKNLVDHAKILGTMEIQSLPEGPEDMENVSTISSPTTESSYYELFEMRRTSATSSTTNEFVFEEIKDRKTDWPGSGSRDPQ